MCFEQLLHALAQRIDRLIFKHSKHSNVPLNPIRIIAVICEIPFVYAIVSFRCGVSNDFFFSSGTQDFFEDSDLISFESQELRKFQTMRARSYCDCQTIEIAAKIKNNFRAFQSDRSQRSALVLLAQHFLHSNQSSERKLIGIKTGPTKRFREMTRNANKTANAMIDAWPLHNYVKNKLC